MLNCMTKYLSDLDGDMYDIFWDSRLTPRSRFEPADYPILPAINIGRQIMTQDITRHFVDHMKNDNVGMLSNLLLSLSDRRAEGTRDPDCIKIAGLISTALDFPKTGIKVCISSRLTEGFWSKLSLTLMFPGGRVNCVQMQDTDEARLHGAGP